MKSAATFVLTCCLLALVASPSSGQARRWTLPKPDEMQYVAAALALAGFACHGTSLVDGSTGCAPTAGTTQAAKDLAGAYDLLRNQVTAPALVAQLAEADEYIAKLRATNAASLLGGAGRRTGSFGGGGTSRPIGEKFGERGGGRLGSGGTSLPAAPR